jgi:hypothetical protein
MLWRARSASLAARVAAHRRSDAAAFARDVRVRCTVEAPLEFVRAIARVDEMRVAIDEARHQPVAGARERRGGVRVARQVARGPTHAMRSSRMPTAASRIAP